MTSAAIFDLDGTLIDTPSAIGVLLTQVLTEYDRDRPREEIIRTIGKPLELSLAGLLGATMTDPITKNATARYRELFEGQVLGRGVDLLYPGVAQGLAVLSNAGIQCAIATSKDLPTATALLDSAHIRGFFPVVIAHDMVTHGKPHPEMAERAARELGHSPAECAYVGDTTGDMVMAVTAGMIAIGVSYGVAGPGELMSAGASKVCGSFGDAIDFLSSHLTLR